MNGKAGESATIGKVDGIVPRAGSFAAARLLATLAVADARTYRRFIAPWSRNREGPPGGRCRAVNPFCAHFVARARVRSARQEQP
jgi:hypothetical protein